MAHTLIAPHTKFQMQRRCICGDRCETDPLRPLLPEIERGGRCARHGGRTIAALALPRPWVDGAHTHSTAHQVSDATDMYWRR